MKGAGSRLAYGRQEGEEKHQVGGPNKTYCAQRNLLVCVLIKKIKVNTFKNVIERKRIKKK